MSAITKDQIKRLYVLGKELGMVIPKEPDDMLHALVSTLTGKSSIRTLNQAEFKQVQAELLDRMKLSKRGTAGPSRKPNQKSSKQTQPGMMTAAQQKLAWRLVYRLVDSEPESQATAGQRMVGATKRVLDMDADIKDPFRWVTMEQASTLIESLKRYVRSAERKAAVKDGEKPTRSTNAR